MFFARPWSNFGCDCFDCFIGSFDCSNGMENCDSAGNCQGTSCSRTKRGSKWFIILQIAKSMIDIFCEFFIRKKVSLLVVFEYILHFYFRPLEIAKAWCLNGILIQNLIMEKADAWNLYTVDVMEIGTILRPNVIVNIHVLETKGITSFLQKMKL